jgi:23S rRNA pseudouridine1911/1915/1917 synthase
MKHTPEKPSTVQDALRHILGGASNSTMKQYLKNGRVRLNGVVVKVGSTPVPNGMAVEVVAHTKERRKKAPFRIVWEDLNIVVAIKPQGILSSGEGITRRPTMHKLVDEYVKEESRGKKAAYVVHRLDKEVSGLIIFAKTEAVRDKLKDNWATYTKRYLALTESKPEATEGKVDTWLAEFKQTMQVVEPNSMGAVRAVSQYKYIRPEGKFHLLEVTLETGKKNQIRVHLAHIGCHIVGDRKYGADASAERKVRLLSYFLEITHPMSGQPLKFEIQPDAGFLNPAKEGRK